MRKGKTGLATFAYSPPSSSLKKIDSVDVNPIKNNILISNRRDLDNDDQRAIKTCESIHVTGHLSFVRCVSTSFAVDEKHTEISPLE